MADASENEYSGRRRRANVQGGRQHRHEVKVSPEEEGVLLRLALQHRVTVPRLLVEAAMSMDAANGESIETPTQRAEAVRMLFGLRRQLGSMANNVNQIARVANTTGVVPSNYEATMTAIVRTAREVEEAVEMLRGA